MNPSEKKMGIAEFQGKMTEAFLDAWEEGEVEAAWDQQLEAATEHWLTLEAETRQEFIDKGLDEIDAYYDSLDGLLQEED